ncbi:hypothetical protein MBLNU230_g7879t1 [Neophaeotheca triangularis]
MASSGPSDGIIRTQSGRQTYAPDGESSLDNTASATQEASQPQISSSFAEQRFVKPRDSNLSHASTLAAHSRRVSEERRKPQNVEEEGQGFDEPTIPAATGADDSNSSDRDVEKQEQSQEKGESQDEEGDPNVIGWDGPDDPENPQNWPEWKKWVTTLTLGIMTFSVTFASSVFSTATGPTAQLFDVSTEVMILGTSLFVLGFAFGPIVWGPFSELFGRKIPLFTGFFIFAIFNIPVAVAQNIWTVMICRFFGGFFASAPLAIVGGALADFFGPVDRGIAVCIFAGATFIGPVAGPIVGGFVTMSYLGWRWTAYLTAIMAFAFGFIGWFIVDESLAPVLLSRRAKKIRFQTQNWAVRAPMDEKEVNAKELLQKYLFRPFVMLAMEPILVLVTLYMGLIYGILYLFFEAYPIAFQEQRGWNLGVGALPFIAIAIGVVFGGLFISVYTKLRFAKRMEEEGGVVPEERLIPMIVGGFVLPAGLFWFAWTSSPNITPWPQIIAGVPIGMGILMIFLQGLNYLIDVYKMNANSAIAANTFFRSWMGGGFPMFANYFFHRLGVDWATSLLGFLCVAMFPVPVLFYIYGARIRKLSKFTPE